MDGCEIIYCWLFCLSVFTYIIEFEYNRMVKIFNFLQAIIIMSSTDDWSVKLIDGDRDQRSETSTTNARRTIECYAYPIGTGYESSKLHLQEHHIFNF